jgi:putative hemolysin
MPAALKVRKSFNKGARILPRARATIRLLKQLPRKTIAPFRRHPLYFFRDFKPKYVVRVETEGFILKTAETMLELRQVLELRHDIFLTELQGKVHHSKMDVDEFDQICDHLIIIDKKTFKVIGTYRVISSLYSNKFYSEGEFHLAEFMKQPGAKLELGRACIHKDFRTGATIGLLWKGIVEYIKKTDTKYLFGCASVQTMEPVVAGTILEYLKREQLSSEEYSVSPTDYYKVPLPQPEVTGDVNELIPALVHSYVKAGAKFYGAPAYDRDFNCFDFFMVLKIEEMSKLFRRRFGV